MELVQRRLLAAPGGEAVQLLEWLRPDGCYFDTGYLPTPRTRVEFVFQLLPNSDASRRSLFLFGSRATASSADQFVMYCYVPTGSGAGGQITGKVGGWAFNNESVSFSSGRETVVMGDGTFDFCGQYSAVIGTQSFTAKWPIYLFTVNQGGAPHSYYSRIIRFYRCRITEAGVPVMELVPALREGMPMLYDLVGKSYIARSGGGSLSYA